MKLATKEIGAITALLGASLLCLSLSGCGEVYATLGHRPVQTWHETKSFDVRKSRPLKCWFVACPEYTKQANESDDIQGS